MIRKIMKKMQFEIRKMNWRRNNKHNETELGKNIDYSKITVGVATYGKINVKDYADKTSQLHIGSFCSIAENVLFMLSGGHRTDYFSTYPFKTKFCNDLEAESKGDIVICDDVWIGENSLILSGVNVGQGAVIAAGAVVCKDVKPYSIVGGVPARLIRYRFDENIIELLKDIDFKSMDSKFINEHIELLYSEPTIENVNTLKKLLKRYRHI